MPYLEETYDIVVVGAGLAEYLDIDPTIVRIVWVLMVLFAGFGILLYVILWLIMPKQQIG